jgi:hypothetical protein
MLDSTKIASLVITAIDIATNVPIELLEKQFKTAELGKSKELGIILVSYGEFSFEVAQFSQISLYSKSI